MPSAANSTATVQRTPHSRESVRDISLFSSLFYHIEAFQAFIYLLGYRSLRCVPVLAVLELDWYG